jgi:hypothetical protein
VIPSQSKTIILTAGTITTSLILILTSIFSNAYSQGLEIPDFKSKFAAQDSESTNVQNSESPPEEIAMKILLDEHENQFLDDYYQVDDFAFVTSNTSKLCPTPNCEYEIDDGQMQREFTAGERTLTGKFKVDTGESKKVMNLRASWETVEERETPDGETVNVIEGTFGVGKNQFNPEHEYQITGTLTPDGDGYILEAKGYK